MKRFSLLLLTVLLLWAPSVSAFIDIDVVMDSTVAAITSGTISGVEITGSNITLGAGNTLDVSLGTFTVDDDQIPSAALNLHVASPIGDTTPSTGDFTELTASGNITGTGKVNDVKEMSWAPVQVDAYVTVKDGIYGFVVPDDTNSAANWDGLELKDVTVGVGTKGVTGSMDIQIRRVRAGTPADMLSTKVTVGDEYYACDGVVNASNDDIQVGDLIFVDCDAIHSGTAAKGLMVTLLFR